MIPDYGGVRVADDPLAQVQQQLAALLHRVELLEQHRPAGLQPSRETAAARLARDVAPGTAEPAGHGVIAYSGSVDFAGKPLKMHSHQPVAAAFSGEPEGVARIFGALGSPHRVLMLRALCDGPKTGQQLEDAAGISSTGQLYHHIKELLAAGLVVQPARSVYALRPTTVIAVCVALMLASDLASATGPAVAAEPDEDVGEVHAANHSEA